jgi:hypothetical protein
MILSKLFGRILPSMFGAGPQLIASVPPGNFRTLAIVVKIHRSKELVWQAPSLDLDRACFRGRWLIVAPGVDQNYRFVAFET